MTIELHKGDLPHSHPFSGSVAIDTETLGLNPLRDRLCLVQLSSGDGTAHLVQFDAGAYDAPVLRGLLADPDILKIFHFARFDLATLFHHLGVMGAPVYCTKIASKLTRTYTDRHSLKDICRELLNIDLAKQQQSSDWDAQNISQEQLDYAAADVLHLHRLKEELDARLARENRQDMARACFEFLPARVRLDLAGWADTDIFAH